MHLRGITILAVLAIGLLLPADLPTAEKADPAIQQQRQMELAALYERLHAWHEAEAQFVAAAQGPSEELRKQALQGIERVLKFAAGSSDSSSLKLAEFYEGQQMWNDAETHYLAAAKDASGEVRRLALEGLNRVRDRIPRNRLEYNEQWFDILSGLVARVLAVVFFAVAVFLVAGSLYKVWNRIQVIPFAASSEAAGSQIIFWLGHLQTTVRSATALPSAARVDLLPYLRLPELEEQLPDLGEIAIAGVKFSIRELLHRLVLPRVRVTGGWITGASQGKAFARFERRRKFSRYESYATIKRDIPVDRQDEELEVFAYHIWIKAVETYVS